MAQGWVWRELEQYKTRICEIGVDGHALYNLEGVMACAWRRAAQSYSNFCEDIFMGIRLCQV